MRKIMAASILLLIVGMLFVAGCGENKDAGTSSNQQKTSVDLSALQGKNELSSMEASALAYQEAKKWRTDAVLWYLNPNGSKLSEQWMNNDASYKWSAIFVNPKDELRFNVTIEGSQIKSAVEEKYVKRGIPVASNLPADRPGIAMNEAGKTVYANNAPSGAKPIIVYLIENDGHKKYRGRPVWEFSYASDKNGAIEAYIYIVDGLNGQLLEIMDAKGNPVAPSASSGSLSGQDGKQQVEQFFASLGSGKVDQALAMMDKEALGNAGTQEMWKKSFNTLASLEIGKIEEVNKAEWTGDLQKYKVGVSAHLKPGSQTIGWEEGSNTRWVTVKAVGGQWKIHELATNP